MDTLNDRIELGKRLRELRTEQGLSLRRFGMMTGLGHSYICEVESGKRDLRLGTISKIVRSLGISLHDFFNWD